MNTDELMKAVGDINDRHVTEFADVELIKKKRKTRRLLLSVISAASLLVLVAVCLWGIKAFNNKHASESITTVTEKPDEPDEHNGYMMGEEGSGITNPTEPIIAAGYVWTPYIILENLEETSESIKLYLSGDSYVNCVRVNCSVYFSYHADTENLRGTNVDGKKISKINNLAAILVPEGAVADFVSHDMVLINLLFQDGIGYLTGYDDKGKAEYWTIDNGILSVSKDECASFIAIYHLNELVDQIAESATGRELTAKENAVPKKKLSNGMTLQEVIGYFEAYAKWAEMP